MAALAAAVKFWKLCDCVFFTGGRASLTTTVVKTVPLQPEPVLQVKPVQNAPRTVSTSSPPKVGAPLLSKTELLSFRPPSTRAENPPKPNEDTQKSASFPSSSPIKIPPPLVTPKPQSPVNVVSPMTKSPPVLRTPPVVTTPLTPTKPVVPTYVPVTSTVTPCTAPTPIIFSPQVIQTSSLSPFVDGVNTGTRGTPSTGLRQGIPQKPYTFLEEKARWGTLDPPAGLNTRFHDRGR